MTAEEKITILVERYCRNRSHLADMIGVTPQAVNNWVYRDRIPRKGIEAIMMRFPEVDLEWLRGGSVPISSGPLPLPDDEEEEEDVAIQFASRTDAVSETDENQFGNTAQSKASAHFVTGIQPTLGDAPQPDTKEGLIPLQMPRQDIKYVFQCHGDSMLPRIQNGNYVAVGEPLGRYEEFRRGVPYLVQTTDGRLMVKLVEDPGPAFPFLLLSTENPNYQLADGGRLAKKDFKAAYRVLMVMRDI
jgi:phage repressor protein C with HTH and peptisase S24 domain